VNFKVKAEGIDKVMKKFTIAGIQAQGNADKITETYTRKMANESASNAPVDTSDLKNSILASPRRIKAGTWEYGSELPYAQRQEYEHKSKKGFIRKSVWNNRTPYREALKKEFSKWD